MENTMAWTITVVIRPPDGGRDKRTPGVRAIKYTSGTMISARVSVNLKTNLIMSHDTSVNTRAWNMV
jgi:hypothetical protein